MSKELKQFRKGTKSCVECRQRKLRCILASDESQPCQNCAAKGRNCVLQVHAGRRSDTLNITSRDRIRHLEDSVGTLWSVVQDLRKELGHTPTDQERNYGLRSEEQKLDDSGSETSDFSPMHQPSHLQRLFDNEVLDNQGISIISPGSSSDRASVSRARNRLQALVPPRKDVEAIAPLTQTWFNLYNKLFPPFSMFKTFDEVLAQYDALLDTDASPVSVAALLLWMAIAVQNADPAALQGLSQIIKDGPLFVRQVSEAVEEGIVTNDSLAASMEGLEVSLLWIRLRLVSSNIRRVWLMLRRCIALAELIGLPRVAQQVKSNDLKGITDYTARQKAAAGVWESICIVDRISGLIFNLPAGTSAYGYPSPGAVISPEGNVAVIAYFNNLGRNATAIQDIDDAYFSQRSDVELFDKVFKVDQDLRSLRAMTPETWWALGPECGIHDQMMQYWHYYLTIRAHLQLALRNTTEFQCAYSYLTCTQACRELAVRYVKLRSTLPPNFFIARIVDLEAMTAAIFLLYSRHRSATKQVVNLPPDGGQSSHDLAFDIVRMMERVYTSTQSQVGCDVARKASKAIRQLDELLNQTDTAESRTLSLKIPLLGNVNVSRHRNPTNQQFSSGNLSNAGYSQTDYSLLQREQNGDQNSFVDMSGDWSMDLLMGNFQPLGDDFFEADQWFSFTTA